MFESDDFDQVLSQLDFPELPSKVSKEKENVDAYLNIDISVAQAPPKLLQNVNEAKSEIPNESKIVMDNACLNVTEKIRVEVPEDTISKVNIKSPKHTKRKIINSYFDHQSKRKFPGPAGLLTGSLEEPKDDNICQIELLSQDIDCSQNNFRRDLFESPIWMRLCNDTKNWNLHDIDCIKTIKQQAISGNLRRRKAQTVTAFVEAVDRYAIDPLIILRDSTGSIKCTLHRDAWSTFAPYIVSEYCALVLQKPTVLTTGSAFKKHYLNITLSNILAIYSSAVLNEDANKTLPDGYSVVWNEEFTVIKTESSDSLGTSFQQTNGSEDLLDVLDSFFADDVF